MIGYQVVNLIVPGEPREFSIPGATGDWHFTRRPTYEDDVKLIREKGACAETYSAEHPASLDARDDVDAVLDEFVLLCLACSYVSGSAVTAHRSTWSSDVLMMSPGEHLPRDRSLSGTDAVVATTADFVEVCRLFMANYARATHPSPSQLRVMVHHFLDALSCWSLEDLYLSGTTILQVAVAAEELRTGQELRFLPGVTAAATRFGLGVLSRDFKDMRNDLVHDGVLSGSTFSGRTKQDCARVAADVFDWLDDYFHAVLGLGSVRHRRFDANAFRGLNAFSI